MEGYSVHETAADDRIEKWKARFMNIRRGDVPAFGSSPSRLPTLAPPNANESATQSIGDLLGLAVGVNFDHASVRCQDDEAFLMTVVIQPFHKLRAFFCFRIGE